MNRFALLVACTITQILPLAARANESADGANAEDVKLMTEQRSRAYGQQMEAYLRKWLVDDYPARAAKAWNRDYTSVEAFLASVEPNRKRWRQRLNPPALQPSGPLDRRPYERLSDLNAEWLTLPLGPVNAEALLVIPASAGNKLVPLVIAQHGLGGAPECVFGLMQNQYYHGYARELVKAGFAVLAPVNLSTAENRNRIERLCRLADTTLAGIELTRLQRLLDVVSTDPRIDPDRIGMWGLSLGGMATMFWTPLEPRIKVGIVSAWFNRRTEKMAISSDLYSCFLDTREEHAFLRGWLTEFSDTDVAALICPRPLMIQTGKKDPISHWPHVVEDFQQARKHYEKLGLTDRIQMDLHDGGHDVRIEPGIKFLTRWLMPTQTQEKHSEP